MTAASNKEVRHFQEILAVLKEEHKKEEDQWFEWSKWAVGATLGVISIAIGFSKSSDTYIIYVFSSIVTFAVIRKFNIDKIGYFLNFSSPLIVFSTKPSVLFFSLMVEYAIILYYTIS
jgi:hypothetical protein